MRPQVWALAFVVAALVALGTTLAFLTIDLPIYFGTLHADYPDSDRPGHLKGAFVSTPELIAKVLLASFASGFALWIWRRLKRLDKEDSAQAE